MMNKQSKEVTKNKQKSNLTKKNLINNKQISIKSSVGIHYELFFITYYVLHKNYIKFPY